MEIGNIVYLYTLNLEENLAIKQELSRERFGKVLNVEVLKGGSKDQQYLQFQIQSLFCDNIYTINNLLCAYKFCELKDLERVIDKINPILVPNRLEAMTSLIQEVKDLHNNKDKESVE